jgi:hypothetical protein
LRITLNERLARMDLKRAAETTGIASAAMDCRSVSPGGVPTVLLRRSLPAELLPYFAPETCLSPRNARRLLSIEGKTPNYSGCHSARDASRILRVITLRPESGQDRSLSSTA